MQTESKKDYIKQIVESENEQIRQLHSLVSKSLLDEDLLTTSTYGDTGTRESWGERIADKVASFGGSWPFIIMFLLFVLAWIAINTLPILPQPFDAYPYIFLNLILGCVAALQAPVIMMSQNRRERKDRKRGENDYLINLKAEIEIRNLHKKIDLVMLDQLKNLLDIQKQQTELLAQLKEKAKVE